MYVDPKRVNKIVSTARDKINIIFNRVLRFYLDIFVMLTAIDF